MIANPVFIIGTERSGSNLLRLLLNAHPNIAIPHPPHLMRDLSSFSYVYGDLTQDANLRKLVRDTLQILRLHFAPWPFVITEKALLSELSSPSLYGIYTALYELYRKHSGKKRWGCKSTFMYLHIGEILAQHSSPKFLHLVRDPRDVAASAEHSIFSQYHPYKTAQLWTKEQTEIEKWQHLTDEGKILRVRYEDLTVQPESELKRIMNFLSEDFQPQQLQFFKGPEANTLSKLSASWKHCANPVSNQSIGRFQSQLSSQEITYVEMQTHELMRKYGYELTTTPRLNSASSWELARIEYSDKLMMLGTEIKSLLTDKNFFLRWKKKCFLQYIKRIRSLEYEHRQSRKNRSKQNF